jgi:hypothetical protein
MYINVSKIFFKKKIHGVIVGCYGSGGRRRRCVVVLGGPRVMIVVAVHRRDSRTVHVVTVDISKAKKKQKKLYRRR